MAACTITVRTPAVADRWVIAALGQFQAVFSSRLAVFRAALRQLLPLPLSKIGILNRQRHQAKGCPLEKAS